MLFTTQVCCDKIKENNRLRRKREQRNLFYIKMRRNEENGEKVLQKAAGTWD